MAKDLTAVWESSSRVKVMVDFMGSFYFLLLRYRSDPTSMLERIVHQMKQHSLLNLQVSGVRVVSSLVFVFDGRPILEKANSSLGRRQKQQGALNKLFAHLRKLDSNRKLKKSDWKLLDRLELVCWAPPTQLMAELRESVTQRKKPLPDGLLWIPQFCLSPKTPTCSWLRTSNRVLGPSCTSASLRDVAIGPQRRVINLKLKIY
jgi:hypothetical protein